VAVSSSPGRRGIESCVVPVLIAAAAEPAGGRAVEAELEAARKRSTKRMVRDVPTPRAGRREALIRSRAAELLRRPPGAIPSASYVRAGGAGAAPGDPRATVRPTAASTRRRRGRNSPRLRGGRPDVPEEVGRS
jgi:hypothetical protein